MESNVLWSLCRTAACCTWTAWSAWKQWTGRMTVFPHRPCGRARVARARSGLFSPYDVTVQIHLLLHHIFWVIFFILNVFNFFSHECSWILWTMAGWLGPVLSEGDFYFIFLKQPCGFWRGFSHEKEARWRVFIVCPVEGAQAPSFDSHWTNWGSAGGIFTLKGKMFFFPTLTFCGMRLQKTKKKKQCFKTFFTLFLSLSLIFFNVLFFFLPLFSLFLAYFFTWLFSFFFAVFVEFCSFILWFKYIYIYKTFPPVLLCFTLVPFFSLTFFFHIMFILVVFPIKNVPFFPSFLCF